MMDCDFFLKCGRVIAWDYDRWEPDFSHLCDEHTWADWDELTRRAAGSDR